VAAVPCFLQIAVQEVSTKLAAHAHRMVASRERQRVARGPRRLTIEDARPIAERAKPQLAADIVSVDRDL